MATTFSTNGNVSEAGEPERALSAAQRARAERNRLRARALRDARLLPPPAQQPAPAAAPAASWDSGGGFLLETAVEQTRACAAPPPAPLQAHERLACLECGLLFATSHLLDTFDHRVCDACRDDEGVHALLTRTEAKSEFLLKDCDLDSRPPPLRCMRRPNPHRGARADMRLYLRAQVEARALQVWGSAAALEAEREERQLKRAGTRLKQSARRLRELRMAVRSSLYTRGGAAHAHRWGPEERAADDCYSRACLDCGHVETYEKM